MNLADIKLPDTDTVEFAKYQNALFFSKIDGGYPVGILEPHTQEHDNHIKTIFKQKLGKVVTEIVELNRRTLHYVYLVKTTDGEFIIRINAAGMFFKELQFYVELWAQQELAKLNLPHITIYDIDTSRNLVPFDFEVSEVVKGKSLHDLPLTELNRDMFTQLGKFVGAIHNIKTQGFGPLNIPKILTSVPVGVHESWSEFITLNLDHHLEYDVMTGTLTVAEADAIRDELEILKTLDVPQPVFVHGDIANHNTFADNGKITAVIDWEDCFSGDPIFDIAYFGTGCYGHEEWMEGYLDGYRMSNQLPVDFERRYWSYYLRIAIAKSIVRYRFKMATKRSLPDVRNRLLFGLSKLSSLVI
jgi:aminoglycoside phosphotransferase (APT) family kinase protein